MNSAQCGLVSAPHFEQRNGSFTASSGYPCSTVPVNTGTPFFFRHTPQGLVSHIPAHGHRINVKML